MAPLAAPAPAKKRKVAFEDNNDVGEPVVLAQKKRRKVKQSAKNASTEAPKPSTTTNSTFKVITGSYEKILYGLEGSYDSKTGKATLKPIFIFPAHISCIKSLAATPGGGKWLATGSADEVIKIWDLRRRKEVGGLMQHEGSITQLSFPTKSHMFSASEDGTINVFQVKDWIPIRTLKGHKGRVNSIAIHPSLKVTLSVGKDKMLRMWDLSKGKSVASTKLGKEGEAIRWSSSGKHFAVLSGLTIEVYSTDMKLTRIINHPSRLHDLRFLPLGDRECLLIAAEDKKVSVYDFDGDASPETTLPPYAAFVGHTNRVRSIDLLTLNLEEDKTKTLLVSVSSDGHINLYDSSVLLGQKPPASVTSEVLSIEPIGSYDTKGTRLTCVTFAENGASAAASTTNDESSKSEKEVEMEFGVQEQADFKGDSGSDSADL